MTNTTEIEEQLMGILIEYGCPIIDKYYDYLKPELFTNQEVLNVYNALIFEFESGNATVNLLTVRDRMIKQKTATLTTASYLQGISNMENFTRSSDAKAYLSILYENYLQRILLKSSEEIKSGLLNNATDIQTLATEMQSCLDFINGETQRLQGKEKKLVTMKDYATDMLNDIQKEKANPSPKLSWGIKSLDNILTSLFPSDLIIVGARPAQGKTLVGLSVAIANAKQGFKVGVISLEMSGQSLSARQMVAEHLKSTGQIINVNKMRMGQVEDIELDIMLSSIESKDWLENIYIEDTSGLRISQIKRTAQKWKEKGLDMLVVDYLQLAQANNKNANKVHEVTEIAEGLKAIAKDLKIPVIALAQLSRAVEQRQNKRPQMADLRESGGIEQAGDVIVFLYRDEYYGITQNEAGESTANIIEYITAKQRNGQTGIVKSGISLQSFTIYDLENTDIQPLENNIEKKPEYF